MSMILDFPTSVSPMMMYLNRYLRTGREVDGWGFSALEG